MGFRFKKKKTGCQKHNPDPIKKERDEGGNRQDLSLGYQLRGRPCLSEPSLASTEINRDEIIRCLARLRNILLHEPRPLQQPLEPYRTTASDGRGYATESTGHENDRPAYLKLVATVSNLTHSQDSKDRTEHQGRPHYKLKNIEQRISALAPKTAIHRSLELKPVMQLLETWSSNTQSLHPQAASQYAALLTDSILRTDLQHLGYPAPKVLEEQPIRELALSLLR